MLRPFLDRRQGTKHFILMSPTVNSRNYLCTAYAPRLIKTVTHLIKLTAMTAPGLARTYLLASASCSTLLTVPPTTQQRTITGVTRGLLTANYDDIIIANVPTKRR